MWEKFREVFFKEEVVNSVKFVNRLGKNLKEYIVMFIFYIMIGLKGLYWFLYKFCGRIFLEFFFYKLFLESILLRVIIV